MSGNQKSFPLSLLVSDLIHFSKVFVLCVCDCSMFQFILFYHKNCKIEGKNAKMQKCLKLIEKCKNHCHLSRIAFCMFF